MDPRNSPFGFAPPTPHAVDEVGDDVKEFEFFSELIDLFFDFGGFAVFDGYRVFLLLLQINLILVKRLILHRSIKA